MKILSVFVLSLFCCGILLSSSAYSNPPADVDQLMVDKNKEKVKIDIEAVKGEKEKADELERELEDLDGVYKAKVCHYRGLAKIKYNPDKVSVEDFTEIIDKEGYAYSVR